MNEQNVKTEKIEETSLEQTSNVFPLSKKEKIKKFMREKKKLVIAIGVSVATLIIALVISLVVIRSVAEDKVVGTWQSQPVYLSQYGGDCVNTVVISDNGTWVKLLINVDDEEIVSMSSGTWEMDGMEARCKEKGAASWTTFRYHISGKLTNGLYEYKRIDD